MIRWAPRSPETEPPIAAAPPTDGEELFDRIAAAVVRRGLATPAVLFLELNRPLAFLAGPATHVLFPFLAPLIGLGKMREIARALDDPACIDQLLDRIERLSSPRPRCAGHPALAAPGTRAAGGELQPAPREQERAEEGKGAAAA